MIKRNRVSTLLFIAAAVLILGLSVLSYLRLNTLTVSGKRVNHTNLVKFQLEKILSSLNEAESNNRGFLLTRDSSFLAQKENAIQRLRQDELILERLISDNPYQQKNLLALKNKIELRLNALSNIFKNYIPSVIVPVLKSETQNGKRVMEQVKYSMQVMTKEEDKLLSTRIQNYNLQLKVAPVALFFLSLIALLFLAASFYLLKKALKKSERLQISENQLEQKIKERTAQLQQRNDFVETVLDSSIDLVSVYDRDLRVLSFNKACEEMLRVSRQNVVGKVLTDVFPATSGGQGYNDLLKALNGEAIHNKHYRSPLTGRIYENFILPLENADGSIYAAVSIAHDNTEIIHAADEIKAVNAALEARNEFVESLINASPDIIIVVDRELKFLTVNNKAIDRFRLLTGKPVTGQKLTDVLPAMQGTEEIKNIAKAFEGEVIVRENVRSHFSNDYFGQSFIPLKNGDDIYAVMMVSHNVTELVNVTSDLKKTNEELSSFAHIASHDLQEPLRKIQMFVQRLKEKEKQRLSTEGLDYFERIENASQRMQKLILDLLSYSGATTDDQQFEKTDLNILLTQVLGDFKEKIDETKSAVRAGQLPIVSVIPFQFHQLFTNLISNSLKFTLPGEPAQIHIEGGMAEGSEIHDSHAIAGAKYYFIGFTDKGIGFDDRYSEKIFKLFQRLHGRNQYEGTGIGLSIVKKVIDNHRGIITAESELGKGATFKMYIPVS